MNYQETVDYLYSCLPDFQRVGNVALNNKLDKITAFSERIGNPHTKFKSVHVAGTNGKGSSSHMLSAILQSSGYKTGLYTSPHLKSFTERIRIDGQQISEDAVVLFVEKYKALIDEIQPSFFEMTVAMAFEYFAEENVDVAVIEVGLGGRLDATNIIEPLVSLITNISSDHVSILGNSLEEIAGEKAGIIKENVPVVISETQEDILHVFNNRAEGLNAPVYFADKLISLKDQGVVEGKRQYLYNSLKIDSALTGLYQTKNIKGVLQVALLLKQTGFDIPDKAIQEGISEVVNLTGLKGRWQILSESPALVCDTGHNEAGIKEVLTQINYTPHKHLFMILGMVSDKEVDKILMLLPKDATYIFCQPKINRAMPAYELNFKAKSLGLNSFTCLDVNLAIQEAKNRASASDLIFVGGSNFVVAEIKAL